MKTSRFLNALKKAGKRAHLIGTLDAGVVVALDMEGRWFATLDGEILNRVNPEAIDGQSTRDVYLNPGGDGLWPAPEGTTVGYEYSTSQWRVPPGLTAARYLVTRAAARSATICAEIDLVNNSTLGIPTIFQRQISVTSGNKATSLKRSVTVKVKESITYLGSRTLQRTECLLTPWTLCQFDSGPGSEVVFPCTQKALVWDLYDEPSDVQRDWPKQLCHTRTDGSQRYQIGIGVDVPWIEFRNPNQGLTVRRTAASLSTGQKYIDIRDAAPDVPPSNKGVRYSVYSDPTHFMEIEAAGGCPSVLRPNTEMSVTVSTRFTRT